MPKPFLTANWKYLAMLNFAIDPCLLAPCVPLGMELDFYQGDTYVSVVGFLFHDTLLLGLPIPGHRNFEEVNLRFYVRRKSVDTWQRGVVFIRELVPRFAIAATAQILYGEPYRALPMRSEVRHDETGVAATYEWCRSQKWEHLMMSARGAAQEIPAGSQAEFITEHYWGYTRVRGGCSAYRVEHPRWKIWNADNFEFRAGIEALYGEQFVETLSARPRSAFIADGSPVTIEHRSIL